MDTRHHGPPVSIKVVQEGPKFYPGSSSSDDTNPDDDFYTSWDKFIAKSPSRAAASSSLARRVAETAVAADKGDNGLNTHESPTSSYEEAKAECTAKVRAIVAECRRLNQKYVDRHFDLENQEHDCIFPLGNSSYDEDNARPSAVKRIEDIFENPQFNENRASASDVIQGQLGDCWLLAALMSLAAKPGLIKRLCVDRDEQVGVYGFVFFRDGAWVPEVIDDRLFLHVSDGEDLFVGRYVESGHRKQEVSTTSYDISKLRENLQKGGEALFFARCKNNSDTWLPLIEKAYAKSHGDYGSVEGGDTSEGIEDLTGGVSVSLKPSQILDKQRFWEELSTANDTYLFAGGAKHYERGGKTSQHAYAVLQVLDHKELKLLKLRDPWGRHQDDGPWMHKFTEWSSELVDRLGYNFKDPGVFWMTYENFLRHFYIIDRTRLFTDEWRAIQQWTSVNVPPVADYLDTQFILTISQPGPVVLVLCQPDTRYFRGLEGRYEFSLHFRIYPCPVTTSSTYIARSMLGSGCTPRGLRSVTADLDLPAGTYSVVLKITAERYTSRVSASSVVASYSSRREKLLQTGRNFDLAHAKGRRRDKERENREKEEEELKRRRTERNAKSRKVRQEAKRRDMKRRERIEKEKARRKERNFWREVREKAASKGVHFPADCCGTPSVSPPPPDYLPPALFAPDGSMPTNAGSPIDNMTDKAIAKIYDAEDDIVNDDFEWDPEIDDSVSSTSDSSDDEDDIYSDDPWSAVCVLGLRAYLKYGDAHIKVVEGTYQPNDEVDIIENTKPYDGATDAGVEVTTKEENHQPESKKIPEDGQVENRAGVVSKEHNDGQNSSEEGSSGEDTEKRGALTPLESEGDSDAPKNLPGQEQVESKGLSSPAFVDTGDTGATEEKSKDQSLPMLQHLDLDPEKSAVEGQSSADPDKALIYEKHD